jgi:hypothetical protein
LLANAPRTAREEATLREERLLEQVFGPEWPNVGRQST